MEAKVSSMPSVFVYSLLLLPFLSQATSSDLSPFRFFKDLQGSKKGDKVEGIHKVRNYLQRFGYLSSTHSKTESQIDSDDHFDDALESAIKAFQTYFHLKPTGILLLRITRLPHMKLKYPEANCLSFSLSLISINIYFYVLYFWQIKTKINQTLM